MFLKAFRVKSSSQMKGSDKKKLKADLKKKFPSLTDDSLNALIPNKDEVVVSKVYTFGGDSLLVYYHAKCPLFFEFEKERGRVFPTVYALWRVPGLAPATFPTWSNVLPKIANGADLMLPGFVIDQELGEKAYHGPGGKLAKVNLFLWDFSKCEIFNPCSTACRVILSVSIWSATGPTSP